MIDILMLTVVIGIQFLWRDSGTHTALFRHVFSSQHLAWVVRGCRFSRQLDTRGSCSLFKGRLRDFD